MRRARIDHLDGVDNLLDLNKFTHKQLTYTAAINKGVYYIRVLPIFYQGKKNPRVSQKTRETLIILHDSSLKVFLMNVSGTLGSPHRGGNAARLVEAILEGARL